MKKYIVLLNFILITNFCRADEGMWLPILLEQLNIADMQARGFKLTAEDIYSVNKSSMKDAVVLFGGGCTGEVISKEGLIITNHHCGFSTINSLSSVENNYLKDGFWAKNKNEEKPCPGLSVTFIISMHDVTDSILPYLNNTMDEGTRNAIIAQLSSRLETQFEKGNHYDATVRSFYYGNEFYLFVTEVFTDIRLVGAPPASVGNFGGETDNWVWPRHTGDFSMFRIYANADNKPAAYDEKNVPFIPRYSFPISLKGVEENDFTMVYGFPGRTQEYLTSYAVDLTINTTNPNRIACRDVRLEIYNKYMSKNDTITLQYASKAKGLANAYKKWKGEMTGLQLNDAVGEKLKYEKLFQQWANTHEGKEYKNLLSEFSEIYASYKTYSELVDYTSEAFYAVELLNFSGGYRKFINMVRSDTIPIDILQKEATKLQGNAAGFYKNYSIKIDREMFAAMMKIYSEKVSKDLQSPYFKEQAIKYNNNFTEWADAIYRKSVFADQNKLNKLLSGFNKKKGKKLMNDPAYKLYEEVTQFYEEQLRSKVNPLAIQINVLMRQYMQAQREMQPKEEFYPDANSTLRLTYGNVKGYIAKDAVYYTSQTTDNGIEEKYIPNDEEFEMPEKLISLMKKNDFGRYANKKGELPIAFIATNHTTGGNSGSPVINAYGQLIGINYDRVWEGTMSDIMYDPDSCRNISLDIRYALFIIDKYGGASNLINEMELIEN
ncbi:MAG: S46 family peptidase [Bacteroidetes bacterium]|nr:S46 family peptidase [Bacteroidota bacterium]